MRALFPFLTAFASGELRESIRRAKRNAFFYALIAFFALILVAFALVAGQIYLAGIYGPLNAALIIAGAALVIMVLLFIAMKISAARDRRRARERKRANASLYTTAALTMVPYILKSRATLILGVPLAALAGYFILGGGGKEDDD